MRPQRGNILFLILLAVVLFAALAYAVTSSMRGGGKSASSETLGLLVSGIQNQGIQIQTAIQRMMLMSDYKEWQIEYTDANYTPHNANTTCTTDSCRLYAPSGGGVAGYNLPANHQTASCGGMAGGKSRILAISVKGIGVDNNLDMVLNYGCVSNELCMAVNDANGVPNTGGVPPTDTLADDGCTIYPYNGAMTASSIPATSCPELGVTAPGVAGKKMFCVNTNAPVTGNSIFYVMQER